MDDVLAARDAKRNTADAPGNEQQKPVKQTNIGINPTEAMTESSTPNMPNNSPNPPNKMIIFSTFDNTVIKKYQYFTSVLPIG